MATCCGSIAKKNDTAIPDRLNCSPSHQNKAAIPDRFNGVLVRKCLDAVWQAGAVFCLLPPHVAWIKEGIEQHMLLGTEILKQQQFAKTEGVDADAQLQQAKTEGDDAVADTPGAPTLS